MFFVEIFCVWVLGSAKECSRDALKCSNWANCGGKVKKFEKLLTRAAFLPLLEAPGRTPREELWEVYSEFC